MNHEDLFRLHLSGAGEYKYGKLMVNDHTLVEFIDGMSKYIMYLYWNKYTLDSMIEYSYGKQHGKLTTFRLNGAIFSVTELIAGKKEGQYVRYNNEGSIIFRCNYVNDEQHGEQTRYDDDGTVRYRHNYTRGVRDEP